MGARASILSCVLGLSLLGGGWYGLAQQRAQEEGYRQLAMATHREAPAEGAGDEASASPSPSLIPWDELRATNGDLIAWIRVDGTGIDAPVCRATTKAEGWYLSHDFWGNDSLIGCPYLSERCEEGGRALILYSHHITGSNSGFSDLYDMHKQQRFEALGEARYDTPGQSWVLVPLCACEVDENDTLAQRTAFSSQSELGTWLEALCERASAKAPNYKELAQNARRAISLVTCSSLLPGQPWRCVVTFVATPAEGGGADS